MKRRLELAITSEYKGGSNSSTFHVSSWHFEEPFAERPAYEMSYWMVKRGIWCAGPQIEWPQYHPPFEPGPLHWTLLMGSEQGLDEDHKYLQHLHIKQ